MIIDSIIKHKVINTYQCQYHSYRAGKTMKPELINIKSWVRKKANWKEVVKGVLVNKRMLIRQRQGLESTLFSTPADAIVV